MAASLLSSPYLCQAQGYSANPAPLSFQLHLSVLRFQSPRMDHFVKQLIRLVAMLRLPHGLEDLVAIPAEVEYIQS